MDFSELVLCISLLILGWSNMLLQVMIAKELRSLLVSILVRLHEVEEKCGEKEIGDVG